MVVTSAGDSGEERALARRFECGDAETRAMIYGSVLASFNIEAFSLERLRTLRKEEINARYQMFGAMSEFEPADLDQPRSHGGGVADITSSSDAIAARESSPMTQIVFASGSC
jgi:hypothetical protein